LLLSDSAPNLPQSKGGELYARFLLAKTLEGRQKVIRDMQRINMEARKYPKAMVSPMKATSLRQGALRKQKKAFGSFGSMMEASP
jgi:hypothetical protein